MPVPKRYALLTGDEEIEYVTCATCEGEGGRCDTCRGTGRLVATESGRYMTILLRRTQVSG